MSRRRSLLSVVSNRWYPYSYEYLYHNLIPNEVPSFNLWDEEWELGALDSSTGQPVSNNQKIRSKNYIPCSPNTPLYLYCGAGNSKGEIFFYDSSDSLILTYELNNIERTTPSNAVKFKIGMYAGYGTTYNHDICINKSNSQLNGIYAPYNPHLVGKKTKLATIEGNGEIVNQLVKTDSASLSSTTSYGLTASINNEGVVSISGTITGADMSNRPSFNIFTLLQNDFVFKANHKYLIYRVMLKKASTTANNVPYGACVYNGWDIALYSDELATIASSTQDLSRSILATYLVDDNSSSKQRFHNNDVIDEQFLLKITDLTQRYGTGREPTSVTDPRVRRIIENGYIEKNDGTYRSSVVDSLVTRGFNIWDEEWEVGSIDNSTGQNVSASIIIRSKNYISVIPNITYYFYCGNATPYWNVYFYDKNNNFISRIAQPRNTTFNTPSNCAFIRFRENDVQYGTTYNHDICINVSSSLNGTYKPFSEPQSITLPAPIQLDGALDSHSTFEITNTEYVWTRDNWWVDLGSLNWVYNSTNSVFASDAPSVNNVKVDLKNALCNKYQYNGNANTSTMATMSNNLSDKQMCSYSNEDNRGRFVLKDTSLGGDTSLISGKLHFQLATPQITRIPRGRLGVVRLKDLNWVYSGGVFLVSNFTQAQMNVGDNTISNIYCCKYQTGSRNQVINRTKDKTISVGTTTGYTGYLMVYDSAYTNTTDFKNAMQGQFLFYETATDVPDFINQAQTEAGGTINGVEFSWVKNQQLNNGNFANNQYWAPFVSSNSQISISNGILTQTFLNSGSSYNFGVIQTISKPIVGHKYLIIITMKTTRTGTYGIDFDNTSSGKTYTVTTANAWGTYPVFATASNGNSISFIMLPFSGNNVTTSDEIQYKCAQLIDLTLAFPDNIPTSINDPRIQYIIEHGYIPTDTTGTYENVTTQTLANVTFGFKAK